MSEEDKGITVVASSTHGREGRSHELKRIGEYRVVMENYAQLAARRQSVNGLYVSMNALFLTAIGYLISQSHFNSWLLTVALVCITLAIIPLNLIWLAILRRYMYMSDIHFIYLTEIERESTMTQSSDDGDMPQGILSRMSADAGDKDFGTSPFEIRLVVYLLILYPLICLASAGLTTLILVYHVVPALPFP